MKIKIALEMVIITHKMPKVVVVMAIVITAIGIWKKGVDNSSSDIKQKQW